jgi:hypothetical protein
LIIEVNQLAKGLRKQEMNGELGAFINENGALINGQNNVDNSMA